MKAVLLLTKFLDGIEYSDLLEPVHASSWADCIHLKFYTLKSAMMGVFTTWKLATANQVFFPTPESQFTSILQDVSYGGFKGFRTKLLKKTIYYNICLK